MAYDGCEWSIFSCNQPTGLNNELIVFRIANCINDTITQLACFRVEKNHNLMTFSTELRIWRRVNGEFQNFIIFSNVCVSLVKDIERIT